MGEAWAPVGSAVTAQAEHGMLLLTPLNAHTGKNWVAFEIVIPTLTPRDCPAAVVGGYRITEPAWFLQQLWEGGGDGALRTSGSLFTVTSNSVGLRVPTSSPVPARA